MSRRIFDFDDGDYISFSSGNIGIDSDSNIMMRMSDNLSQIGRAHV